MTYDYERRGTAGVGDSRKKKRLYIVASIITIAVIAIAIGMLLYTRNKSDDTKQQTQTVQKDSSRATENPKPQVPAFDADKISGALTTWLAGKRGTYSVVVTDDSGKILAQHNVDEPYFAASIYKLYIAYLGYQKLDDGSFSADTPYANGWTLEKCLDEMIRSSNSPCGERMMAEIGKTEIDSQLKQYGLTGTSNGGLTTTAADVSLVLVRLAKKQDLKDASTKAMLDSMLGQEYRNGLPKGFVGLKVYDKVGFREQVEYHDVGIVELQDGRRLTITVLTENAGVANIASLADAILKSVQ